MNSPNPASRRLELHYVAAADGAVRISIHDLLGREVATVLEGSTTAGSHSLRYDAGDLAAGMYHCRMQAPGSVATIRLVVIH